MRPLGERWALGSAPCFEWWASRYPGVGCRGKGTEEEEDIMVKTRVRETSAGGVIFYGWQVLILHRKSGEWVMPKGKLEKGERPAGGALREVQEETGLSARIVTDIGSTRYRYSRRNSGAAIQKTVYWYLMESDSQRLMLEPSFDEGVFASPEEALRLLTHSGDRDILKQAVALHRARNVGVSL
jgi:8-oxo-dGTP pyrophosphatase MutT (NUDIX family)